MQTEIDLNESEIDLNESEIDLNESEIDLNETEIDLNESEIDLNECEHFLQANLDRTEIVEIAWLNKTNCERPEPVFSKNCQFSSLRADSISCILDCS